MCIRDRTIEVTNVLEFLVVSDTNLVANTVVENSEPGTVVAGLLLEIAGDASLGTINWSLPTNLENAFAIDENGIISVTPSAFLNYERIPSYDIVVQVEDRGVIGTLERTIEVINVLETLTLSDENGSDNTIAQNSLIGTGVSGLQLEVVGDADITTSLTLGFIDDAGGVFTIDPTSGVIRLATPLPPAVDVPNYSVTVVARLGELASNILALTITITDPEFFALDVMSTEGGEVSLRPDSTPDFIDCGRLCTQPIVSSATLVARPELSHAFAGWAGACSGEQRQTTVTLDKDETCYAVFAPLSPDAVVQIDHGGDQTCAVLAGGSAQCWGNGFVITEIIEDVPIDTTRTNIPRAVTQTNVPRAVTETQNAVDVGVGNDHICLLLSDQSVACWGDNDQRQLGRGDATDHPLGYGAVVGVSDAVGIASGNDYSCVVLSDGKAQCWGRGGSGQLGDGKQRGNRGVTSVKNLTTAVDIDTSNTTTPSFFLSCACLLYTSPSPRDRTRSRMPSSA